jgi:SET domain-containing protein
MIWIYDDRIDRKYPVRDLKNFPPLLAEHLLMYTYAERVNGEEVLVYCGDHGKHMNHSPQPNTVSVDDFKMNACFALRDIEAGEELTCNYFVYDIYAQQKLPEGIKAPDPVQEG